MKFEELNGIRTLAVVGARSLVGSELVDLFAEHKIKIARLRTFDEGDDDDLMEPLSDLSDCEVAIFACDPETTRKHVPKLLEEGTMVLDLSGAYAHDESVPLIVPEVNGAELRTCDSDLVACATGPSVPIAIALKPFADGYGLTRIVASTYQPVSDAGREAFEELSAQAIALLSGGSPEGKVFPHQVAFNCFPIVDGTEERVARELRRLFDLPDLRVSVQAVRVPTFAGLGVTVAAELERDPGDEEKIRETLDQAPGIKVLDQPSHHIYPTNIESVGSDHTFVGRLKRDASVDAGISFWAMTDNLRKGSASNALECLDIWYKYRRMT